MFFRTLL